MSSTLQRKVSKVLSSRSRFDQPDVIDAVDGLSELFVDRESNNQTNRRRLRSLLDKRSIQIHQSMVDAFKPVNDELRSISQLIQSLNEQCQSINQSIKQTRESNESLTQRSQSLRQEQADIQHKRSLVQSFLSSLTLSPLDNQAIESGLIDESFYTALAHIGTIRAHCQALLSEYHQRVGLDVLDSLAKRCEVGFERLYKHCLQQINAGVLSINQSIDDDPSAQSLLQALAVLSAMPVYFEHCLNELAQTHRLATVSAFMRALTGSNQSNNQSNNQSRGLDLNAHDSVKYVSDILAWVHNQCANEAEFLETVCAIMKQQMIQHGILNEQSTDQSINQSNGSKQSDLSKYPDTTLPLPSNNQSPASLIDSNRRVSMLGSVFEGLGRVVRVRIEQSLTVQPQPEVAFKLWQIVTFYTSILSPFFDQSNNQSNNQSPVFYTTLRTITENSKQHFFSVLSKQADQLTGSPPSPPHDLTPPSIIAEACAQLHAIIQIKQASPSRDSDVDLAPVLAALLDPMLQAVQSGASSLNEADSLVYSINYLPPLINALKRYEFDCTRIRAEVLSLELDNAIERLVKVLFHSVLIQCGMQDQLEPLSQWIKTTTDPSINQSATKSRLADRPRCDSTSLARSIHSFESLLFSVGSFLVPQCDRILQSTIRRSCRNQIATSIAQSYRLFYEAAHHPQSGWDEQTANHIAKHTPQQIETILEVNAPVLATPNMKHRRTDSSSSLASSISGMTMQSPGR